MRTRLYVAGVFGGLAVLALVFVIVFAFGRHHPSPPSLRDNPRPEIPGEILYGGKNGCYVRAAASGASEEQLACAGGYGPGYFPGGPEVYWVDDTTVQWVQRDSPSGGRLYEVNLKTGEQRDTGRFIATSEFAPGFAKPLASGFYDCQQAPDKAFACIGEDGQLAIIVGDQTEKVARFDLPKYARPQVRAWSPDSQWVLLQYYPPRGANGLELWIVSRDGKTRGTLAKDAQFAGVAWRIEGVGSWPELPE